MRSCAAVLGFLFLIALPACSECSDKLSVTSLKPKIGPYIGGDPVYISGSGFTTPGQHGIKVYFGKSAAKRVTIESCDTLRVEPPAGEIGQTVDVEVIFDDARSGKLLKSYTYIDPLGKDTDIQGNQQK